MQYQQLPRAVVQKNMMVSLVRILVHNQKSVSNFILHRKMSTNIVFHSMYSQDNTFMLTARIWRILYLYMFFLITIFTQEKSLRVPNCSWEQPALLFPKKYIKKLLCILGGYNRRSESLTQEGTKEVRVYHQHCLCLHLMWGSFSHLTHHNVVSKDAKEWKIG